MIDLGTSCYETIKKGYWYSVHTMNALHYFDVVLFPVWILNSFAFNCSILLCSFGKTKEPCLWGYFPICIYKSESVLLFNKLTELITFLSLCNGCMCIYQMILFTFSLRVPWTGTHTIMHSCMLETVIPGSNRPFTEIFTICSPVSSQLVC